MTPYYTDGSVTLYAGDCLDVLPGVGDCSVDAVVTDPPYGLEFMGRDWDGANGFRRSLNPADVERESVFGRTSRTSPEYRTASKAVAGMGSFAMADHQMSLPAHFGGVNPKCLDCGRWQRGRTPCACEAPNFTDERLPRLHAFQAWCQQWATECLRVLKPGGFLLAFGGTRTYHRLTCAIEDAGFEVRDEITWLYGSGFPKNANVLKPGHEPIVVARRPLIGTLVANLERHGTGSLNIDACRVEAVAGDYAHRGNGLGRRDDETSWRFEKRKVEPHDGGRWPTNVVLDEDAAGDLDQQTGVLTSGANPTRRGSDKFRDTYGEFAGQEECTPARGVDAGGASRFFPTFRYEAKAPASERPRVDGEAHETVKPLELMRWLVRLVAPPGGVVLDPFAGSGTTAEACVIEGFSCIAVEREARYLPLIVARLAKPLQPVLDFGDVA